MQQARRPPLEQDRAEQAEAEQSLVLSGGIALGAFGAGAAVALEAACGPLRWIAGASAGAINAAILAGNAPDRRAAMLRGFWDMLASDPMPASTFLLGPPPDEGAWRSAYNQAAAWQTLLWGRPGLFRPRLLPNARLGEVPALYDLAPLVERLPDFIDFDRLNNGETRLSLVATDIVSGARVVFDPRRGDRIGPLHLAACSALLPLLSPIEIGGRLLGDGGLASNVPLDLVLDAPRDHALDPKALECFVVENFARSGSRPRSLGAALARAGDLGFGNQTRGLLHAVQREAVWRDRMARLDAALPEAVRREPAVASVLAEAGTAPPVTLLWLDYHAGQDEAGPGKVFDFSAATLADRWRAGEHAMQAALHRRHAPALADQLAPGLLLHEVPGGNSKAASKPVRAD
jgi:NTE family protein